MKHILWTDEPVIIDYGKIKGVRGEQSQWETQVYPLGNGRLGCTVFGAPEKERVQFNEDSLWVGNEENTGGFQPFGDVYVEMDAGCGLQDAGYTNYRRELDIGRAVQTVTYRSGDVGYRREFFSSYPAQVIVARFTADKPASLSGKVSMGAIHEIPAVAEDDTLVLKGNTSTFWFWQLQLDDPKRLLGSREYASDQIIDLDFEARARVLHEGGCVKTEGDTIQFEGCDTLTIVLAADTNYINERDKGWRGEHPHERLCALVEAAAKRSYDDLLNEHVRDYQAVYGRMSMDLGTSPGEVSEKKTPERVTAYSEQVEAGNVPTDRDLEVLLYQYARYLMISSSRQGYGCLPSNLQGIWSITKHPAWRCDFHTDINIQMNYWFCDASNLPECFVPLAEWIDSIREVRKEETRRVLGVERGWLMRSENGIFGGSTYLIQKGDSAWICQNLSDHFAFTRDMDYLERYAYPVMKEISEFWVDHLKELSDGTLVAPEGISPEHGPEYVDGVTYDQALCWDLFNNTIEASEALDVDADFRAELVEKRDKLLGPTVGKWGQLQEWMEDIDDPEDDHRHISHMIGTHPGRQIHPTITPEFADATRVGLIARRDHGPQHPGWSRVWKACLFARLLNGEDAYGELLNALKIRIYGNLLATHPPFQIDCNFGYAAAVNEMLVQSHLQTSEAGGQRSDGKGAQRKQVVYLLPALPGAWSDGSVKGLRVRGGYELDMEWKSGELVAAELRGVAVKPSAIEVHWGTHTVTMTLQNGESRALEL